MFIANIMNTTARVTPAARTGTAAREAANNMEIRCTEEIIFTQQQVQELFLSVGWVSGQYPERLYKALMNSSTVITAWDNGRIAGLVRVIDDTELVAYIHYVLVHPDYQGRKIAGTMLNKVKEKYKGFL